MAKTTKKSKTKSAKVTKKSKSPSKAKATKTTKATAKSKAKTKAKVVKKATVKPVAKTKTKVKAKIKVKAKAKTKVKAKMKVVSKTTKASVKSKSSSKAKKPVSTVKSIKPVKSISTTSQRKQVTQRHGFKTGQHIVYPSHGVGQIVDHQEYNVEETKMEFFDIFFEKDKLTLKVPIEKVKSVGMRNLSDSATVRKTLKTVQGKAKIKRIMWSRRAQEYEAKINSGDLMQIAEVVRDLFRSEIETEQSYSERQLYEAALEKMTGEIAVVKKITLTEAIHLVEANLAKRPARSSKLAPVAAAALALEADNKNSAEVPKSSTPSTAV